MDAQSRVKLDDGNAIPWLGLGVWQASPRETYAAVRKAIEIGYHHIDTAMIYGNEADVGRAVRESGVPREQLFVTTKLWNSDHGYEQAKRALDTSLKTLGLDYVDLYLIHWPEQKRLASWRALIDARASGKCRSIGVSNFTVAHLDELAKKSDVVPAVNQVEMHPFLFQRDLVARCERAKIRVEAYSPLTRGRRLDHPTIAAVAKKLGRTPAQILIRWGIQHGFVVLPKSVHEARIRENANVFDFEIPADEMTRLDALD